MSNANDLNQLWKIWTLFDPRLALFGLGAFLIVLALGIHVLVLNSARYNWISGKTAPAVALQFLPPTIK